MSSLKRFVQHETPHLLRFLTHAIQNYRLENFESTAESYRQLGAEAKGVENEENDIRINNGAVDAQLQWQGRGSLVTKKQPSREDLEAFETAYNAACGSIARGELAHGEFLLKRAYGTVKRFWLSGF